MTPFPLLELPSNTLTIIFEWTPFQTLFNLSLCSQRTQRAVKTCCRQIDICLDVKFPDAILISSSLWFFRWRFVDRRAVCPAETRISTTQIVNGREMRSFEDLFSQSFFSEDPEAEMFLFIAHLHDVFSCSMGVLDICSVDHLDDLMVFADSPLIRSATKVRVENFNVSHTEMDMLLQCFSPEILDLSCFPGRDYIFRKPLHGAHLHLTFAPWMRRHNLLNLDCQKITIHGSSLTNGDLNAFIKHWLEGTDTKLEFLHMTRVHESPEEARRRKFDLREILRDIPSRRASKKRSLTTTFDGVDIDEFSGYGPNGRWSENGISRWEPSRRRSSTMPIPVARRHRLQGHQLQEMPQMEQFGQIPRRIVPRAEAPGAPARPRNPALGRFPEAIGHPIPVHRQPRPQQPMDPRIRMAGAPEAGGGARSGRARPVGHALPRFVRRLGIPRSLRVRRIPGVGGAGAGVAVMPDGGIGAAAGGAGIAVVQFGAGGGAGGGARGGAFDAIAGALQGAVRAGGGAAGGARAPPGAAEAFGALGAAARALGGAGDGAGFGVLPMGAVAALGPLGALQAFQGAVGGGGAGGGHLGVIGAIAGVAGIRLNIPRLDRLLGLIHNASIHRAVGGFQRRTRNIAQLLSGEIDYENGMDIVRHDGRLATVLIHEETARTNFIFVVWQD